MKVIHTTFSDSESGFRSCPILGRLRLRLPVKENIILEFLKPTTNSLKYVSAHVPVHIGPNLCLL